MTPICQNVHEEDSAQLKDLVALSDSATPGYHEGIQVFISESALYRTQLKDFKGLPGSLLLEHNGGLQVFISESALYRTQLKIWVGYQKAYTVERFGSSIRWTTSKTQRRAPGMHF